MSSMVVLIKLLDTGMIDCSSPRWTLYHHLLQYKNDFQFFDFNFSAMLSARAKSLANRERLQYD